MFGPEVSALFETVRHEALEELLDRINPASRRTTEEDIRSAFNQIYHHLAVSAIPASDSAGSMPDNNPVFYGFFSGIARIASLSIHDHISGRNEPFFSYLNPPEVSIRAETLETEAAPQAVQFTQTYAHLVNATQNNDVVSTLSGNNDALNTLYSGIARIAFIRTINRTGRDFNAGQLTEMFLEEFSPRVAIAPTYFTYQETRDMTLNEILQRMNIRDPYPPGAGTGRA